MQALFAVAAAVAAVFAIDAAFKSGAIHVCATSAGARFQRAFNT